MEQAEMTKIANLNNNISFLSWDLVNGEAPKNEKNLDGKDWQSNPVVLHTNFIFVGLNPSEKVQKLENLHNPRKENNSKLRFAVWNTPFWGSLFMDIEPKKIEGNSKKVELRDESFEDFIKLLKEIFPDSQKKIQIIAFGNDVFRFLNRDHHKQDLTTYFPKTKIIIHKITHYAYTDVNKGNLTYEEYKNIFDGFNRDISNNPTMQFIVPKIKRKNKIDCSNQISLNDRKTQDTIVSQIHLDDALFSFIKNAKEYLQKKEDLRFQKSYSQFYKNGHERECKIRLGNHKHFMDFFIESDVQCWENFLDYIVEQKPEQWKKITGKGRSQLIRQYVPTSKEDVKECCDAFYNLFEEFEKFKVKYFATK